MAPRIDVRPEAFYEAGSTLASDVAGQAMGAASRLAATLDGCGAMAGRDPGGSAWASTYDRAAQAALDATQDALNATYRLACLLERTGLNHALAEAASTAGGGAWPDGWWLSDDGYSFRVPAVASAAGGSGDTPTGWWLVEHTVGLVWPDGHQDRLHRAAGAWRDMAAACDDAAVAVDVRAGVVSEQRSPEVDDAITALSGLAGHWRSLASAQRRLASMCDALAAHIDSVHAAVVDELESLVEWTAGIQVVGGALSFLTGGLAEAPTQTVQAARTSAVAARVASLITRFVDAARGLAQGLPSITAAAESVRWSLEGILGTRVVIAGVTSVRALPPAARDAELMEMAATERLTLKAMGAAAAGMTTEDARMVSEIVRLAARRRGFYGLGEATEEQATLAGMTWVGPGARSVNDGKIWISKDGLRQFRLPAKKKGLGVTQANIESRYVPHGEYVNNGHIKIKGLP